MVTLDWKKPSTLAVIGLIVIIIIGLLFGALVHTPDAEYTLGFSIFMGICTTFLFGGIPFFIILGIYYYLNKKKDENKRKMAAVQPIYLQPQPSYYPPQSAPQPYPATKQQSSRSAYGPSSQQYGISVKSAINYEHAKLLYKVKIENNSNNSISDIRVSLYIPKGLFIADKEEKMISLVRPRSSQTVTFTLRPKGECGNVDISSKIVYYDTNLEDYKDLKAAPKRTAIVCPMLKTVPVDERTWRQITSRLISVQETVDNLPLSCNELFRIVTDVIKDMNMYMVTEDSVSCRFVGRFYCEGIKGYQYCAQIEAIGGMKKSKLIIKAFAENQESLIGFYHKILDEIEERTKIKQYIKDPLIIKGDYFPGGKKIEITDSVIQRSEIGTDIKNKNESDVDWE